MTNLQVVRADMLKVLSKEKRYTTDELEKLIMLTLMKHFTMRDIIYHIHPNLRLMKTLGINIKRTHHKWKLLTN